MLTNKPILVGCCTAEPRVLICEYIPNNTLDFHLHGKLLIKIATNKI